MEARNKLKHSKISTFSTCLFVLVVDEELESFPAPYLDHGLCLWTVRH
jgi:hypothetical protein